MYCEVGGTCQLGSRHVVTYANGSKLRPAVLSIREILCRRQVTRRWIPSLPIAPLSRKLQANCCAKSSWVITGRHEMGVSAGFDGDYLRELRLQDPSVIRMTVLNELAQRSGEPKLIRAVRIVGPVLAAEKGEPL
jgi:hypothetical protein